MNEIILKAPDYNDEAVFLAMTKASQSFHHPWVKAPLIHEEFVQYVMRSRQENQKSYLAFDKENLIGVFNLSEIVYGCFQNAYLGFYASSVYATKGWMSSALKLVLEKAFTELQLHRLEANIQPDNLRSIHLVRNNGFRKEGFSLRYLKIDGAWRDHERWAITKEES